MKGIKNILKVCMVLACLIPLSTAYGSAVNYSVKALIPDNQVDKKQTYFDLRLHGGEAQILQLEVTNSTDETINAYIDLYPAETGRGGLIVYTGNYEMDESMKIPVTDIARILTPEVKIPPQAKELVDIELIMPEVEFDGVILGGIVVRADMAEAPAAESEGISISNEFMYVVGLKLSQNENYVEPALHLVSVKPELVNYRTAMVFNIQNSQPIIMKGIDITAQIYKGGSNDVLYDLNVENAEMAPNSNGDFVIDWNNQAIDAGDYRIRLKAEYEGIVWDWDESFTVDAKTAGDTNNNAIEVVKSHNYWWLLIVLLIMIIIAFIGYYAGKKSKKDKSRA